MAHRKEHAHALSFNKEALEYAKQLIRLNKVNCQEHNWHDSKPTPESEDFYLADHNFADYSKWFLATADETPRDTKEHFEFPIGNFEEIYRSGVIAAKQRAAQFGHVEVEKAAADLLDMIDATACKAKA